MCLKGEEQITGLVTQPLTGLRQEDHSPVPSWATDRVQSKLEKLSETRFPEEKFKKKIK